MEKRPKQPLTKSIEKPSLTVRPYEQHSADKPSLTVRPNTGVTPKK